MIANPFQRNAYDAVGAALPFAIDPAKITVEPGVSYLRSPNKLHDDAAGVMAAFGSVVEHLGRVRALPAQTTLNRPARRVSSQRTAGPTAQRLFGNARYLADGRRRRRLSHERRALRVDDWAFLALGQCTVGPSAVPEQPPGDPGRAR